MFISDWQYILYIYWAIWWKCDNKSSWFMTRSFPLRYINLLSPVCLQVTELLEESTDSSESLCEKYCCGTAPSMAKADIKHDVHKLIHNLVLYIHKNEPDIEKSILIFLPTYYSLEQQWSLLKPFRSDFKVHILHSSVDTNQALMAMKISKSHRKVHCDFLPFYLYVCCRYF